LSVRSQQNVRGLVYVCVRGIDFVCVATSFALYFEIVPTMLQSYPGSQFYWWEKPEYMSKITDFNTNKLTQNYMSTPLHGLETISY